MKTLFACAALLALAACNSEEPAPEPTPAQTQVALPVEPSMAPPDQASFTAAYAEACPDAQPVSVAECRSMGLGEEGFVCEYGLGDDEYMRNKATVVPENEKWVLAEPEKICAADAA